MEKQRDTNIEILRLLLALMVIILHFNHAEMPGGGGAAALIMKGSIRYEIMHLLEALCCCAVNVFIIISGWYMSKKKEVHISSVVNMFIKVIVYNVLFYFVSVFLGLEPFYKSTAFYRIIPTNYFVLLYSVVYVLAPFINYLINDLPMKKLNLLIIIMLVLFSVETTIVNSLQSLANVQLLGVNTVAMEGDSAGYTITNFVLLYMLGAYLKRQEFFRKIKTCMWVVIYLLASIIIFAMSHIVSVAYYYNNIFVVLEAVALFGVFESSKTRLNRGINFLGKMSFDVFLIHTNKLFLIDFWGRFDIAYNYAMLSFGPMLVFSAFCILSMYLLCMTVAIACKCIFLICEEYSSRLIKYKIQI